MLRYHGYSATGHSKRTFWQSVPFELNRRDFHGRLRTADEVHSMSLADLQDEYCTVVDTAAVLAAGVLLLS
jgi:hypothetical protein